MEEHRSTRGAGATGAGKAAGAFAQALRGPYREV